MVKYFYDIPIYRVSEDRYYKDREAYIERIMYENDSSGLYLRRFYRDNPDSKMSFEAHLQKTYGGAWNYNEVVGWIRLHFLGTQVRGEYWGTTAKRIVRSRKKVFKYKAWKLAPETEIPDEASNPEIFQLILEHLSDCAKEVKNRHLDLENFKTIGPHVDWRSLLNENV